MWDGRTLITAAKRELAPENRLAHDPASLDTTAGWPIIWDALETDIDSADASYSGVAQPNGGSVRDDIQHMLQPVARMRFDLVAARDIVVVKDSFRTIRACKLRAFKGAHS